MQRRQYLRAAIASTAALTGCLSTADPEPSPPENARRRVSIGETDALPDDAPLRPSVSVENQWVTLDSTAGLVGTIENVGDDADDVGPLYFRGTSETNGPRGLLLYAPPASTAPPTDYIPPCFPETPNREYVPTRDPPDQEEWVYFGFEQYGHERIRPGESRTDRLLVVDDPTHDGCFPPGEYRFESYPQGVNGDLVAADWTFTVVVEEV